MRRRRFTFGQRQLIWWTYVAICLATFYGVFVGLGQTGLAFLLATLAAGLTVGALGLLVRWLTSL